MARPFGQCSFQPSGGRLNIKMPSYLYRNSHYQDKTVSWPSYLANGNPHIWKDRLYVETALRLTGDPLQWRHNERYGVSNHRRHDCFLNCLSRHRSKIYQSSTPLAFVRGIHQWPMNSHHKGPVTRQIFPFDDVIIYQQYATMCILLSALDVLCMSVVH